MRQLWSRAIAGLCAVSVALGACSSVNHPPRPAPTPADVAASEWPEARRAAMNFAIVKDFVHADSVLRGVAARFPGTVPMAESVYLRALFRLDPSAEATSEELHEARTWLEQYVAGGPTQEHYMEAVVLRRIGARLDTLRVAAAEAPRLVLGIAGARDSARAREDEMARLRTELEATKAELERIRRRLAPPKRP